MLLANVLFYIHTSAAVNYSSVIANVITYITIPMSVLEKWAANCKKPHVNWASSFRDYSGHKKSTSLYIYRYEWIK